MGVSGGAEAASAIGAHQQRQVGLEEFVFILRINDQVGKIKWAPHHVLAGIEL